MDALPTADCRATPVRYEFLDALRGWAILGVISTHCATYGASAFPGEAVATAGRYGVQLFFMVSAFTIFLTLDRQRERGELRWRDFFVRRLTRILPMFWVGLAFYALVPGRFADLLVRPFGPRDYLLSALLQQGWDPGLLNTLVPGSWSIVAEAVFYVLVPWCYRYATGAARAGVLVLGGFIFSYSAVAVLGTLYQQWGVFRQVPPFLLRPYVSFWFPNQAMVFALGILAYHLHRALARRTASQHTGALLLTLGLLAMLWTIQAVSDGAPSEHLLFAGAFVPLMLGLGLCPARWLVNPATRGLGRISYSVYLLHFCPVVVAAGIIRARWPGAPGSLGMYAGLFAVALVVTVPLATLSFRWIEQPGIRWGHRLIARWSRVRQTTEGATDWHPPRLPGELAVAPASRPL